MSAFDHVIGYWCIKKELEQISDNIMNNEKKLDCISDEVDTLNKELSNLTEEELVQISGGTEDGDSGLQEIPRKKDPGRFPMSFR